MLRWIESAEGPVPVIATRERRRATLVDVRTLDDITPQHHECGEDLRGSAGVDFARVECSSSVVAFLSGGSGETRLHIISQRGEAPREYPIGDDVSAGPALIGGHTVAYSARTMYWVPDQSNSLEQRPFPEHFRPYLVDPQSTFSPLLPLGGLPYWPDAHGLSILGRYYEKPAVLHVKFRNGPPVVDHSPLDPDRASAGDHSETRDPLVSVMPDGRFLVSSERLIRLSARQGMVDLDKHAHLGPFGPAFHSPPLTASVTRDTYGRAEIRLWNGKEAGYSELSPEEFARGFAFDWVSGCLVFAYQAPTQHLHLMAWSSEP